MAATERQQLRATYPDVCAFVMEEELDGLSIDYCDVVTVTLQLS